VKPRDVEGHVRHRKALEEHREELAAFSQHLRRLRQEHAVFHRMKEAGDLERRIDELVATADNWRFPQRGPKNDGA
jgi:hypothetical protein